VKQELHFKGVKMRRYKGSLIDWPFLLFRPSTPLSQLKKASTNFIEGFDIPTAGFVKSSAYWLITKVLQS
jgi:hypothetical protein